MHNVNRIMNHSIVLVYNKAFGPEVTVGVLLHHALIISTAMGVLLLSTILPEKQRHTVLFLRLRPSFLLAWFTDYECRDSMELS